MDIRDGASVRAAETGMRDRQASLIAAVIAWSGEGMVTASDDEGVFETADRYLAWLRKEP